MEMLYVNQAAYKVFDDTAKKILVDRGYLVEDIDLQVTYRLFRCFWAILYFYRENKNTLPIDAKSVIVEIKDVQVGECLDQIAHLGNSEGKKIVSDIITFFNKKSKMFVYAHHDMRTRGSVSELNISDKILPIMKVALCYFLDSKISPKDITNLPDLENIVLNKGFLKSLSLLKGDHNDQRINAHICLLIAFFLDPFSKGSISLDNLTHLFSRESLSSTKYYKVRSSKNLRPVDILGSRGEERNGFVSFYLYREYLDDKIKTDISANKHIIITGKSLSGKSRTVYNYLKKNNVDNIIIPDKDYFKSDELEKLLSKQVVWVFKDIERYMDDSNLSIIFFTFLNKLINNSLNSTVIATCRSEKYRSLIDELFFNNVENTLSQIPIKPLSPEEKDSITSNKNTLVKDDTIGSYYIDISAFKNKFLSAKETTNVERQVLIVLRLMHFWRKKHCRDIKLLKTYCTARHSIFKDFKYGDWEELFMSLKTKGFIYNYDYKSIDIENAYFLFIDDKRSQLDRAIEIINIFCSIKNYSRLVYRLTNASHVFLFHEYVKESTNLEPEEYVFNALIKRSSNLNVGMGYYQEMVNNKKLTCNVYTLDSLLTCTHSYSERKALFLSIKDASWIDSKMLLVLLNRLIHLSEDPFESKEWFEELVILKLEPDYRTFRLISLKVNSTMETIKLFKGRDKKLKLTEESEVVKLVFACEEKKEALSLIDFLYGSGSILTSYPFNIVLSKYENSFPNAQQLYRSAIAKKVYPDLMFLNKFLSKAEKQVDVEYVWELIIATEEEPDKFSYNTFMSKQESLEVCLDIYYNMQAAIGEYDAVTKTCLLTLCTNEEERSQIDTLIPNENISYSTYVDLQYIRLSKDFNSAVAVINNMNDPDFRHVTALLKHVESIEHLKVLDSILISRAIKVNDAFVQVYTSTLLKIVNLKGYSLTSPPIRGITPKLKVFFALFRSASTIGEIESITYLYKFFHGVITDKVKDMLCFAYTKIITLQNDFADGWDIIKKYVQLGCTPNKKMLQALANLSMAENQAILVLEMADKHDIYQYSNTIKTIQNR